MALQRVPINNFRGGLNQRDSPFELQPNESPDLSNVTITNLVGALQVRAGKISVGTSPASIDHARQVVLTNVANTPPTTRNLLCSINGAIYAVSPTGAFTLLFTGTAGTIWDIAQMPDAAAVDHAWFANGVDAPQKWDGVASTTSAWAGSPPNGNRFMVWQNKMVMIGVATTPQRAYFSKTGDPEATTGAYDFVDLRGDDDEFDSLNCLNVLADRLYVFKERSVWLFTSATTFANRRIGEPGCYSRFQSDVCDGKLYFFNEQGLWSTAGVTVALESGSITNWFPENLNFDALHKVRMLCTRDTYPRILMTLPTNQSATCNVMIESVPNINFRRIGGRRYLLLPAYMVHTFDASCLANWKPYLYSEWGIFGGSTANPTKLYQYFTGPDDDGVPITARWQSAWLAIQGEEPFERIRRLNVELSGDAIVDVFGDFKSAPDFSADLPDPAESSDNTWDNPPNTWDQTGTWDPPSEYRFARVRPESRARFHSIRFRTVPGGQPFFINVAELVIRGGKEH